MVLFVGSKRVVDVSLKVNGQVRNPEKRPRDVDQTLDELTSALNRYIQTQTNCQLMF